MTTTKSIITAEVPQTLTSVYTNNTTAGAVLKSINLNGVGDPSVFRETTDAGEWSLFGSSINPFITQESGTSTGFGVPYPVQLSDNRVLLLSLPHYQHWGQNLDYMGGNTLHAQIVEHQTNKYVAGPITNLPLPTAAFNSNSYSLWSYPTGRTAANRGGPLFKAIALSPTLVVAAYRFNSTFRLMRITITDNTVNIAEVSSTALDLTGALFFNTTTDGDFELAPVRDDPTKVIVGGYAAAGWCLQAFNIPTTGALTQASTLFNTGISVSTFHFAIAPTTKNAVGGVNYYFVAACTATASFDGQLFSFTTATNAFAAVGIKVTYARTTRIDGLNARCLSTGTTPNLVVATVDTGNPSNIFFYQQINNTQAVSASAVSTIALQHGTSKSITHSYNWGDERAVFIGANNLLVGFNSAGIATSFLTALEDGTVTDQCQLQYFPFNTRPLYTFLNTSTPDPYNVGQYWARKDVTGPTSFGVRDRMNNYLPYGHDYDSKHYAWNEVAQCWIVGQGGRIYALDKTGVVLYENTLIQLNTNIFQYVHSVADLTVTADGRVVFTTEYGSRYNVSYNPWTQYNSLTNQIYGATTTKITKPIDLLTASVPNSTYTSIPGFMSIKLHPFTDYSGTEVIYLLNYSVVATPRLWARKWSNGTFDTGVQIGNAGATAGAWNKGWRSTYRLVQASPCDAINTEGRWRLIGQYGNNTQANCQWIGTSITPYVYASFGSMTCTEKALNTSTVPSGWSPAGITNKNFSIAVIHDSSLGKHRYLYSNNLNYTSSPMDTEFLPSTNNNLKYYKVRIGKNVAAITLNSSSTTDPQSAVAYVYENAYTMNPKYTFTTTSGNGQISVDQYDKLSLELYGAGLNKRYEVSSAKENVVVTMAVSSPLNASTFYITPITGQTLNSSGAYRSTDTYLVPAGYSLKMRADTPLSLSSLVTLVEEA
jgi:hypothetical protein